MRSSGRILHLGALDDGIAEIAREIARRAQVHLDMVLAAEVMKGWVRQSPHGGIIALAAVRGLRFLVVQDEWIFEGLRGAVGLTCARS